MVLHSIVEPIFKKQNKTTPTPPTLRAKFLIYQNREDGAFRRPKATKLLNSLSAKGSSLRNKVYLFVFYWLHFSGGHALLINTDI